MKLPNTIKTQVESAIEFRPNVKDTLKVVAIFGAALVGMAIEDHYRTDVSEVPKENPITTTTATSQPYTEGIYPDIVIND